MSLKYLQIVHKFPSQFSQTTESVDRVLILQESEPLLLNEEGALYLHMYSTYSLYLHMYSTYTTVYRKEDGIRVPALNIGALAPT
jgi:hypothetical protein